jgi:sulfatase maturation enzyme AslB (radical SAM superfamily)
MSPKTLEMLVPRAMAYAEGNVAFAFQGGEPTLAGLDF